MFRLVNFGPWRRHVSQRFRKHSRPSPPLWREVFQGQRGRLVVGLLLLESLIAAEALVIITVMPVVNREFDALHLYGWAFASFSLATFGAIPVAGWSADRRGASLVLGVSFLSYLAGLIVVATSPVMLVLLLGRFLQGVGAGGFYVVALGAVAKVVPEHLRARVLALFATMWIVPGLVGPAFGALMANTVGWRWAFVAPIPLMALSATLVLPVLSRSARGIVRHGESLGQPSPVRWPLQFMVGAGILLAGLGDVSTRGGLLILIGVAIGLPALRRIVPVGTLRARRGIPAATGAAFLLSVSFFAVDGFVPLMLTESRGMTLAQASVLVTLSSVSWAAGSWWQSRRANRVPYSRLVVLGTLAIMLGVLAVGAGLFDVPLHLIYGGWTAAGFGMGVAFPTIQLTVMNQASEGKETSELNPMLLMGTLGIALGAGFSGSAIAVSERLGASLDTGLAGAFGIALAAALLLSAIASRLSDRRATEA